VASRPCAVSEIDERTVHAVSQGVSEKRIGCGSFLKMAAERLPLSTVQRMAAGLSSTWMPYIHPQPVTKWAQALSATMFFSIPATSDLFKVVLYRSTLSCHDLVSVTIGGHCTVGSTVVPCDMLDLGAATMYEGPPSRYVSSVLIPGR
jgi:hypothetical protein